MRKSVAGSSSRHVDAREGKMKEFLAKVTDADFRRRVVEAIRTGNYATLAKEWRSLEAIISTVAAPVS